jgi:hypothetical protein
MDNRERKQDGRLKGLLGEERKKERKRDRGLSSGTYLDLTRLSGSYIAQSIISIE